MRRVVAVAVAPLALTGILVGGVIAWRRNPRIGTAFVNTVVNPVLLRRGLAGGRTSEIGMLEHIGRRSGVRRLTLVHPEPTPEGFRVLVPLGPHSQWALNVLAAGHCRLQVHDLVYDLDEPVMVPAGEADDLPSAVRAAMAALRFRYLRLRTFGAAPGALEPIDVAVVPADRPEPGRTDDQDVAGQLVSSAR